MKEAILLGITIAFLLSAIGVSASCVVPTDGMIINRSIASYGTVTICQGTYNKITLSIMDDKLTLDCNNSVLDGGNVITAGIYIGIGGDFSGEYSSFNDVTIRNCNIQNYGFGIEVNDYSNNVHILNNNLNNSLSNIRMYYPSHAIIANNNISNSCNNIDLIGAADSNIITNNIFIGYPPSWVSCTNIFLESEDSFNNEIYNNTFYNHSIEYRHFYSNGSYTVLDATKSDKLVLRNTFCFNNVGNTYYNVWDESNLNRITGPTCPTSLESRVSALESWKNITDSWKSGIDSRVSVLESLVNGLQNMLNKIIGCTGTQTCVSGGNCTAGCPGGCQNSCVGSVRYFNGNCNMTSCGCSFSTEDCNLKDNWYNTTSTRWVNATSNTEKEQLQQEFRDYGCQPVACTYSANDTRWIDTGATRNKVIVSYCPVKTGFATYLWITNVSLNGNSKTSDSSTYSNFTDTTLTNLTAGSNYTLYVSASSIFSSTSFVKAWIDFNNDGNFSTDEEINLGSATFAGSRTFSKNFLVPINAIAGETRMRVYVTYNSAPSPCVSATYGEIEDYKINIRSQNAINQQNEGSGNVTSGNGNNGTVSNVTLATDNP